jgi:hypothetical protein
MAIYSGIKQFITDQNTTQAHTSNHRSPQSLQLPGEQVPLKSAFQTFTRHFKEPLLSSRLADKNRDAENAVLLPFVSTANLSNCARSATVPRFAASLRGNGFAESAKGPRFVSTDGERQNARSVRILQFEPALIFHRAAESTALN